MPENIIRTLPDGLILRAGCRDDEEALAAFNREIHGEDEWDSRGLEDWTHDLISGEMPTFQPSDFTIIEDSTTHEIVSTCCTISQTWAYEGIPFKVGRPELVGTKPAYRRRGLVREQFEVLHRWSAERGELVQIITGIPYYYRQFGYEMTLNLEGWRGGYEPNLPLLKDGETEPFSFRLATEADIPFLMSTYERGCARQMIAAVWNEALWRYEITGKRRYNINRRDIYIIEDQDSAPVGMIGLPPVKWGASSVLTFYDLAEGYDWSAVTPSVIRFLWKKGKELGKEQNQTQTMFIFALGETHPAYQVAESHLPRSRKPYTYYVRVPDLAGFLTHIKPALERRLVNSAYANYSGQLNLDFYQDGLSFTIQNGHISAIRTLDPGVTEDLAVLKGWDAQFPPLTFLHLVFGYRSVRELEHAFTDCILKKPETGHLLEVLFPKKPSDIWSIS